MRDPRLPNPPQPPEVARRGAALVRMALGLPPKDPRLMAARCPWCGAGPGFACLATGRPLRLTPAHPARYAAAGLEYPVGAAVDERGAA